MTIVATGSTRPAATGRGSRRWLAWSIGLILAGCGTGGPSASTASPGTGSDVTAPSTVDARPSVEELPASPLPDWYGVALTDVRSGRTFSIGDFAGKVVLIETIAEWCPTCIVQQAEVRRLHDELGDSADVVSVSLDVDVHEDAASLEAYAAELDLDWYVAIAPLAVARALGNLYSAEYLNPPLSPMLLIARDGTAVQLPYGVKKAEDLREMLEPYLAG